mmetsp:Transcript_5311/g.9973  ORF Transcript_5311/g.9973 Transcript_5311/m.9973 type:complete len:86 (-) Transcript_5311:245-502(-)
MYKVQGGQNRRHKFQVSSCLVSKIFSKMNFTATEDEIKLVSQVLSCDQCYISNFWQCRSSYYSSSYFVWSRSELVGTPFASNATS